MPHGPSRAPEPIAVSGWAGEEDDGSRELLRVAGPADRHARQPATAQFKAVAAAVEAGDPMMLSILYGDWEGGQRVISQFALRQANDRRLTSTGRHFNVDRPDPR
jgi:hypothetical protein